jgi:hypothetical protein
MIALTARIASVRVNGSAATTAARAVAGEVVVRTTEEIRSLAVAGCPVGRGSGHQRLKDQHGVRIAMEATRVVGQVVNTAPHAAVVHKGSRSHAITARNARVLRFTVGGEVLFRRTVNHPGTTGRPWLAQAAQVVAAKSGYRWIPAP